MATKANPHCPVHVAARMRKEHDVRRLTNRNSSGDGNEGIRREWYRCTVPGCPCVVAGKTVFHSKTQLGTWLGGKGKDAVDGLRGLSPAYVS